MLMLNALTTMPIAAVVQVVIGLYAEINSNLSGSLFEMNA